MGSNTIRFTGLASGLDTESLVKAMLYTDQNKINKQTKKQQLYTWKQEAWKEMNSKINSFNEKYVDKLRMQSTFIKTKVTSSNDKALSVSENSNIGNGIHKVEIKQLATSAYMMTKQNATTVQPIDVDTKLADLGIMNKKESALPTDPISLQIKKGEDYKTITIDPNATLGDLQDQLRDEGIELSISSTNGISLKSNEDIALKVVENQVLNEAGVEVEGIEVEGSNLFSKLGMKSGSKLTLEKDTAVIGSQIRETEVNGNTVLGNLLGSDGNPIIPSDFTLNVNGKNISLTQNDTINSMISKIKGADSNLSVSFDSGMGQFFVTSTATGAESQTQISGGTEEANKFLDALGLVHTGDAALTQGKNALYKYNGMGNNAEGYFESASNTVKINGLEMTFKEVTSEPITVQGSTNTDEMVEFMKEFVSEYNKLMEDINTKLKTKTSKDYEPLTDEEKEATTEANVEKIEKYVKDGLFYRDSDLMELRDSLRDTMSGVVASNEKYKTLYSVGITTGNWRENGKLYFDEETFVKALQENQEDVLNLFSGSGDSTQAVKEYMEKNSVSESEAQTAYNALSYKEKQQYLTSSQGIFTRINSNFSALSKSTDFRSYGSYYNDKLLVSDLKDVADRIYTLNQRYTSKETALYKKFTAMEKTISQLNSQQSSLASMMGTY